MKLPVAPSRTIAGAGNAMLPLINVVFLLMVFFMLVGSLAPRDVFEIDPARSRQLARTDVGNDSLVVGADGRLGWGGQVFALDQLKAQAATWQARHAGQVLEVKADASLDAQTAVAILEVLRGAGITQVKLLAANAG